MRRVTSAEDLEIVVTVIATGFDDGEETQGDYPQYVDPAAQRKPMSVVDEEYDIPPFLRDRDSI